MDNIRTHKKILIPACTIVVIAALLIIFNAPVSQALSAWNFTPKKETYTELYFNNPENLPKSIVTGEKMRFSFTIHNVEGTQVTYPYTINFVESNGHTVPISKKTITLADGASQVIAVSVSTISSNEKGHMVVTLTNLNQSIDFILPNNN
jgi:hypothetical protein